MTQTGWWTRKYHPLLLYVCVSRKKCTWMMWLDLVLTAKTVGATTGDKICLDIKWNASQKLLNTLQ